jgi:predicted O-methyltransferase YrrM
MTIIHSKPQPNFYHSFASKKQKILLWRCDSHHLDTLQKLKQTLNDNKIDFLFLDGDHSYEGIKQDFEWYAPLVRSGGMIAFHDIKPSLPDNWIQVGRFWESIKNNYQYKEILCKEASWGGIGILYQK